MVSATASSPPPPPPAAATDAAADLSLSASILSLGTRRKSGAAAAAAVHDGQVSCDGVVGEGRTLTQEALHGFVGAGRLAEEGLSGIASLDAVRGNIAVVRGKGGLNVCAALKTIDLSYNRVAAFEDELRLPKLMELVADFNRLAGGAAQVLRPVLALQTLARLSLSDNHLTRSAGLNALYNLKVLKLDGNNLREVRGLELPLLEVLDVSRNEVESVGDCKLPRLLELTLACNRLTSFRGLDCFTSLRELDASCNAIDNVTTASAGITQTFAGRRASTALTPLRFLQNLRTLNLRSNRLSSLSFLPSLPKLTELLLSHNELGSSFEHGDGSATDSAPPTPLTTRRDLCAATTPTSTPAAAAEMDDGDDGCGGAYITDEDDMSAAATASAASAKPTPKPKSKPTSRTASRAGSTSAAAAAAQQSKKRRQSASGRPAASATPSAASARSGASSHEDGRRRNILKAIADLCPALEILDVSDNRCALASYQPLACLRKCKALQELWVQGSTPAGAAACEETTAAQPLHAHLNAVYRELPSLEVIDAYVVSKTPALQGLAVEDVDDPAFGSARESTSGASGDGECESGGGGGAQALPRQCRNSFASTADANTIPCDGEEGVWFRKMQKGQIMAAWNTSGVNLNGSLRTLDSSFTGGFGPRPGTASSASSAATGGSRPAMRTLTKQSSSRQGRSYAKPEDALAAMESMLGRLRSSREVALGKANLLADVLHALPADVTDIKEATLKVTENIDANPYCSKATSAAAAAAASVATPDDGTTPDAYRNHVKERARHQTAAAGARQTTPTSLAAPSPPPKPCTNLLSSKPQQVNLRPTAAAALGVAAPGGGPRRLKYHHLQKRAEARPLKGSALPPEKTGPSFAQEAAAARTKERLDETLVRHHTRQQLARSLADQRTAAAGEGRCGNEEDDDDSTSSSDNDAAASSSSSAAEGAAPPPRKARRARVRPVVVESIAVGTDGAAARPEAATPVVAATTACMGTCTSPVAAARPPPQEYGGMQRAVIVEQTHAANYLAVGDDDGVPLDAEDCVIRALHDSCDVGADIVVGTVVQGGDRRGVAAVAEAAVAAAQTPQASETAAFRASSGVSAHSRGSTQGSGGAAAAAAAGGLHVAQATPHSLVNPERRKMSNPNRVSMAGGSKRKRERAESLLKEKVCPAQQQQREADAVVVVASRDSGGSGGEQQCSVPSTPTSTSTAGMSAALVGTRPTSSRSKPRSLNSKMAATPKRR